MGFKYLAVALFLLLEQEHINLASSEEMLWENEVSDAKRSIKLVFQNLWFLP